LARVNKTVRVSRSRAQRVAASCQQHVRQYAPDLLSELQGMSEGSGVPLEEIMMLQVRNQFPPEKEGGCTSFSTDCRVSAEGRPFVGQNWDNDPALDAFTVVLTRRPDDGPAIMTVTQAGLISYIGFNEAGIGACVNTLPAPSREAGVPHYFTLRMIYAATTLDGAIEALRRATRAIPANIMLSTPDGPADLEVTIDDIHVLRDEGDGIVTHTNHCLHPDLAPINEQFDELIQSRPRKARIDELLRGRSHDLGSLRAALADHDGHPCSICRHANDHPQNGFWETVFSVIIDPQARQMHLTRGTPCSRPFEVYQL
jgi:isopenicillin-N N-acyltransferase-like protein